MCGACIRRTRRWQYISYACDREVTGGAEPIYASTTAQCFRFILILPYHHSLLILGEIFHAGFRTNTAYEVVIWPVFRVTVIASEGL
jgi:hypothetical protein